MDKEIESGNLNLAEEGLQPDAAAKAHGGQAAGGEGEDSLVIVDDWLLPEEMEQAGDLGGEGDDTDGPAQAKERSRLAALRKVCLLLKAAGPFKGVSSVLASRGLRSKAMDESPTPHSEWKRLGDEALGLAPTPVQIPMLIEPIDIDGECEQLGHRADPVELCESGEAEGGDMDSFKRTLASLKEIVALEVRQSVELGRARKHLDRAEEASHQLAKLAIETLRGCRR
ncbi:hypothetical protein [Acidovorax soli]|uniref:Uncharacterized protein n=1 Tax=Acidovorax soli TaxID=592050 RepID=A0A1H4EXC1_9BURK|nr:hypothetical protein [Acidovorax soli]SEA89703.1 hypothetical protein SAMN05421875_1437 [Acidovorax soli]